jgi:hypothetical protein
VGPPLRTVVYFVIKNLIESLSVRQNTEFHFFVQDNLHGYDNLSRLLPKALSSINFAGDPLASRSWDWTTDRIHFFSGFYPLRPEQLALARNCSVYQIIHDVAAHGCPEFANDPSLEPQRDFERWLVSGLGVRGHAFCVSRCTQLDLIRHFNFPDSRTTVIHPAIRSDSQKKRHEIQLNCADR